MDILLTRELEVLFLERLARDRSADAWSAVQLRDAEMLVELQRRLPRTRVTLADLLQAAQESPALNVRAAPPDVVLGVLSRNEVHCNPRKLPGVGATATQADFDRLAKQFHAANRQPVAGLTRSELQLNQGTGTLRVFNAGYGPDEALSITGLLPPAWLLASWENLTIRVQPNPAFNGCYRGSLTIQTTSGTLTAQISAANFRSPAIQRDPVHWRDLMTRHPDLDEEGAEAALMAQLQQQGYRPLAGGFFTRARHRPPTAVEAGPTLNWTLQTEHLRTGRLPASEHAPLVRLYAPDGTERYDVSFDGQALHGKDLRDLTLMWQLQAGTELRLSPYRGHYQFELRRAAETLHRVGEEYGVVSTLADLHRTQGFWSTLEAWLLDAPVRMLLDDTDAGVLRDLSQQHAGRLTVRRAVTPMSSSRVYVMQSDGTSVTQGLPEGQPLQAGRWPEEDWRAAEPRPRVVAPPTVVRPAATPQLAVLPYPVYTGQVAHPLLTTEDQVIRSLTEIVRLEGPVLGHHLYERYGQRLRAQKEGAALTPMGLKRALNRAVYRAVTRNALESEDERGLGGQIGLVYRVPGQPNVPRSKGDRRIEHIPPSELQAVIAALPDAPTDLQERAACVLEALGFGRFVEGGYDIVLPLLSQAPVEVQAESRPSRRRSAK